MYLALEAAVGVVADALRHLGASDPRVPGFCYCRHTSYRHFELVADDHHCLYFADVCLVEVRKAVYHNFRHMDRSHRNFAAVAGGVVVQAEWEVRLSLRILRLLFDLRFAVEALDSPPVRKD